MDARIRIAAWGTACLIALLGVPRATAQTAGDQEILAPLSVEFATLRVPIADQVAAIAGRTLLAEPDRAREATAPGGGGQLGNVVDRRSSRPAALTPLYYTLMTLQVLDVHSTVRAVNAGHHEANPLMRGIADNTAALAAVKGASTAGLVLLTERLRKNHPRKAVILLTAMNVALAAVVANNYRIGTGR
jgi:hypothetical protein